MAFKLSSFGTKLPQNPNSLELTLTMKELILCSVLMSKTGDCRRDSKFSVPFAVGSILAAVGFCASRPRSLLPYY
jgi:dipeptide/tripeptide permease